MSGERVLVTGASGFIGRHLCRRLAAAGQEVHGVSRAAAPDAAREVRWQHGDLADVAQARRIVQASKPAVVYHLASHVMGAPDIEHVLPTFAANLQTTVNLLALAVEAGCRRVVLTGSLVEPVQRPADPVPSSPYAAAKWASGDYARMFHALYGLSTVIARVFMVYGPGQRDESKLVPYVIRSVQAGRAPDITSGNRPVDWVYVDDVASGLEALGAAAGVGGRTVDLGSGRLVTIRELVDLLLKVMGTPLRAAYGARPDRPLEPERSANLADTAQRIGWSPQVGLEEGLRRTVAWYQSHPA